MILDEMRKMLEQDNQPHDFEKQLKSSMDDKYEPYFLKAALSIYPDASCVKKASKADDKRGVDYWIIRGLDRIAGIDGKHRKPEYRDDLCIEVVSRYYGETPFAAEKVDWTRDVPGWTVDHRKITDLVLYTWPTKNSDELMWKVYYFRQMCRASRAHAEEWISKHFVWEVKNNGYLTICVFVPTDIVEAAIASLGHP